jgi:hypothetical protein
MGRFLEYQVVDRRKEIAEYENRFRPFPPRKGSVSKPRPSIEPELQWLKREWAEPGMGTPITFRVR